MRRSTHPECLDFRRKNFLQDITRWIVGKNCFAWRLKKSSTGVNGDDFRLKGVLLETSETCALHLLVYFMCLVKLIEGSLLFNVVRNSEAVSKSGIALSVSST